MQGFSPLKTPEQIPSGIIKYSCSEKYGYLRVRQEMPVDPYPYTVLSYIWKHEVMEELTFGQKFKLALDEAFTAFAEKEGLILDLRGNNGDTTLNRSTSRTDSVRKRCWRTARRRRRE